MGLILHLPVLKEAVGFGSPIYVLDKYLFLWTCHLSSFAGSSSPITQFSCVSDLRKQQAVTTTVYFSDTYVALAVTARQSD